MADINVNGTACSNIIVDGVEMAEAYIDGVLVWVNASVHDLGVANFNTNYWGYSTVYSAGSLTPNTLNGTLIRIVQSYDLNYLGNNSQIISFALNGNVVGTDPFESIEIEDLQSPLTRLSAAIPSGQYQSQFNYTIWAWNFSGQSTPTAFKTGTKVVSIK
jgi:hypothetical protein|tara:strand:+ start:2760 stop:3239 length:480 start_codon:yes stop_codon:yes gene_type:complete